MSVIKASGETKGVDSSHSSESAIDAARELSHATGSVISVSGTVDIIIRGEEIARVKNGHALMPKVTGLGCTASALTGAFAAVNPQLFWASCHAMAVMGIAGEIAAQKAEGPGTFQVYFLDTLHQLNESDVTQLLRVEIT